MGRTACGWVLVLESFHSELHMFLTRAVVGLLIQSPEIWDSMKVRPKRMGKQTLGQILCWLWSHLKP